jgi:hypothetical protein
MIGNASIDIWVEGVKPIVKFKDDLDVFHFLISGGPDPGGNLIPYSYAYDRPQALS